MVESWYKPGDGKITENQIVAEDSCSKCKDVLPKITGDFYQV